MKVFKVPFANGMLKTEDCKRAPYFILKSLEDIYSNSRGASVSVDFLSVFEMGMEEDSKEDNDFIYRKAFDSFSKEKVCFLGGDHSVSYPLTRAFFDWSENNGREPALIVFDAHPDLMEPTNKKNPTNEEWLRALIEDGFNPKNILLVGVRNSDSVELNYLEKKGIMTISMQDLFLDFLNKIDAITEFGYGKDVYVSFDIDFVDPAYAPGTSYIEPGGASSKEFLYIVSRIAKIPTLRAVDFVELSPKNDFNCISSKLVAKALSEFF